MNATTPIPTTTQPDAQPKVTSVYVWLNARALETAGACAAGVAEVRRLAAEQGRKHKVRLDWSPAGSADIWKRYPDYCSWLAQKGLIPPSATAGARGTATAGNYGTATAGARGTATAGDYGTATAGNYGTATAGYDGTATAGNGGTATAGNGGTATAGNGGTATAGNDGTATAGNGGTATAGNGGTATAGNGGTIRIRWWDGSANRYRWACADIGDDGIVANVPYVVRDGKLARKDGAA